jgi:hypothetical protein
LVAQIRGCPSRILGLRVRGRTAVCGGGGRCWAVAAMTGTG